MIELGERLGVGAGAEVFAFGAGRVIKLWNPGTPPAIVEYELQVTRAAFASGARAPEVFGIEVIDGRDGLVMQRCDGDPLLDLIVSGAISPLDAGRTLATVHADLHRPRYRSGLWSLRQFVDAMGPRLAELGVPADVIERATEIAHELPNDEALCHGDLHFGNVLMTQKGPTIIDWISAMSASPLVDVARQHLTLAVFGVPDGYADARREAEASFMQHYATLTGVSEAALRAAIPPYAAVMAATRMCESGCDAHEREKLIALVRGA